MKNSNYVINGILIVAIIVLFILQFTGKRGGTKYPENAGFISDSTGFHLPLAYVKTDSLMAKYNFFNDMSSEMMKKLEDKRLVLKQREDKLKKEIADFYQKVQNNIFYSQERQMQEQNRLIGLQQELENYAGQIQSELSTEEMKMHQQLRDTIVTALKLYNTPKKYEFIFSNVDTDNILYADDLYDITIDVVEFLNARYVPSKK